MNRFRPRAFNNQQIFQRMTSFDEFSKLENNCSNSQGCPGADLNTSNFQSPAIKAASSSERNMSAIDNQFRPLVDVSSPYPVERLAQNKQHLIQGYSYIHLRKNPYIQAQKQDRYELRESDLAFLSSFNTAHRNAPQNNESNTESEKIEKKVIEKGANEKNGGKLHEKIEGKKGGSESQTGETGSQYQLDQLSEIMMEKLIVHFEKRSTRLTTATREEVSIELPPEISEQMSREEMFIIYEYWKSERETDKYQPAGEYPQKEVYPFLRKYWRAQYEEKNYQFLFRPRDKKREKRNKFNNPEPFLQLHADLKKNLQFALRLKKRELLKKQIAFFTITDFNASIPGLQNEFTILNKFMPNTQEIKHVSNLIGMKNHTKTHKSSSNHKLNHELPSHSAPNEKVKGIDMFQNKQRLSIKKGVISVQGQNTMKIKIPINSNPMEDERTKFGMVEDLNRIEGEILEDNNMNTQQHPSNSSIAKITGVTKDKEKKTMNNIKKKTKEKKVSLTELNGVNEMGQSYLDMALESGQSIKIKPFKEPKAIDVSQNPQVGGIGDESIEKKNKKTKQTKIPKEKKGTKEKEEKGGEDVKESKVVAILQKNKNVGDTVAVEGQGFDSINKQELIKMNSSIVNNENISGGIVSISKGMNLNNPMTTNSNLYIPPMESMGSFDQQMLRNLRKVDEREESMDYLSSMLIYFSQFHLPVTLDNVQDVSKIAEKNAQMKRDSKQRIKNTNMIAYTLRKRVGRSGRVYIDRVCDSLNNVQGIQNGKINYLLNEHDDIIYNTFDFVNPDMLNTTFQAQAQAPGNGNGNANHFYNTSVEEESSFPPKQQQRRDIKGKGLIGMYDKVRQHDRELFKEHSLFDNKRQRIQNIVSTQCNQRMGQKRRLPSHFRSQKDYIDDSEEDSNQDPLFLKSVASLKNQMHLKQKEKEKIQRQLFLKQQREKQQQEQQNALLLQSSSQVRHFNQILPTSLGGQPSMWINGLVGQQGHGQLFQQFQHSHTPDSSLVLNGRPQTYHQLSSSHLPNMNAQLSQQSSDSLNHWQEPPNQFLAPLSSWQEPLSHPYLYRRSSQQLQQSQQSINSPQQIQHLSQQSYQQLQPLWQIQNPQQQDIMNDNIPTVQNNNEFDYFYRPPSTNQYDNFIYNSAEDNYQNANAQQQYDNNYPPYHYNHLPNSIQNPIYNVNNPINNNNNVQPPQQVEQEDYLDMIDDNNDDYLADNQNYGNLHLQDDP